MAAVAWTAIGLLAATIGLLGAALFTGIHSLGARIDGLQASLNGRIDGLQASLSAKIDALGARLDARIDGLSGWTPTSTATQADRSRFPRINSSFPARIRQRCLPVRTVFRLSNRRSI